MKKVLIAIAVIALFVSFISCKKCVTCHYDYIYLGDTITTAYPDECGKTSEINDFKDEKGYEAMRQGAELICEDVD